MLVFARGTLSVIDDEGERRHRIHYGNHAEISREAPKVQAS